MQLNGSIYRTSGYLASSLTFVLLPNDISIALALDSSEGYKTACLLVIDHRILVAAGYEDRTFVSCTLRNLMERSNNLYYHATQQGM